MGWSESPSYITGVKPYSHKPAVPSLLGYISHKFSEYSFLGAKVEEKKTWMGSICRIKNALMTPRAFVFKDLVLMEKLFICYHGESCSNQKKIVKKVRPEICKYAKLSSEYVNIFLVKCRMFFRISFKQILCRFVGKSKKQRKQIGEMKYILKKSFVCFTCWEDPPYHKLNIISRLIFYI